MTITYDLETTPILKNGLVSKIHIIALKIEDTPTKVYTSHYHELSDGSLTKAIELLKEADLLIGHNAQAFDKSVLEAKYDVLLPVHRDTLIISKLMYSKEELYDIDMNIPEMPKNLWSSFSLAAWGYRLQDNKLEFSDWKTLSTDMITYAAQDVDLTYKLYNVLKSKDNYPNEQVLNLEHTLASIIQQQSIKGWYFDKDKADKLMKNMLFRKFSLEKKLQSQFKGKFLKDGPVKKTAGYKRTKWVEDVNYKGW
jgi:hypothetical protein